jgi:hypothetical protein
MDSHREPAPESPPAFTEIEANRLRLPYPRWWPLLLGVTTGIIMRLIFSNIPGGPFATMMSSFVLLVPLLVGGVTVFVAETRQRRSWWYYIWMPMLANVLFVAGTMAILIEGLICSILIIPLFAVMGAVGGLIMGAVCRKTNWPDKALYSFAVLPFLLGGLEQHLPVADLDTTIEHVRVVNAAPAEIWRQIENPNSINANEVDRAWVYQIGIPLPKTGKTERTPDGMLRHITMGSGIHFDELATVWEPNRHVRWANRFTADSFPPNTMDEHVKIGGRYFGIGDTDYTLTPARSGTGTELRMTVRYRLSTSFNWYAGPILHFLIGNFEDVALGFYARRAEAGSGQPPSNVAAALGSPLAAAGDFR